MNTNPYPWWQFGILISAVFGPLAWALIAVPS